MRGSIRNPSKEAFAQTWINGCDRIIAIAHRSAGNETVGDTWVETKSFPKEASLDEVLNWAHAVNCSGNLVLSPDVSTLRSKK